MSNTGTPVAVASFEINTDKGEGSITLYEIIMYNDSEDNPGVVVLDGKPVKGGHIKRDFGQYQDAENWFTHLHNKYETIASDIDWA